VWAGAESPLINKTTSDVFFGWARQQDQPISPILLEQESLWRNSSAELEKLRVVLTTSKKNGVLVVPLYGWNAAGGGPVPSQNVLNFVDAILGLPEASNNNSGLAGFSFDIEPRTSAGSGQDTYQQYADLLVKVRARLDTANNKLPRSGTNELKLSIAGSWGYESQNVSCGRLGANVSMLTCAVSLVDNYILMNYRNNAFGCSCRPPPQKNSARFQCPADGSPIPGNCTDSSFPVNPGRDGMIAKAVTAARAVKSR
jgi:hypothetical protein